MFVAAKFSTTSSRLTALYSDMPTIGNFWIPVQTDGGDISKALTVWWNSTPVSMMLLNRRSRKLTYPDWSLEHLKEIKIPKSDNPYWPLLTETFESICNEEIQPLKDSRNDPVRQMIDDAAAKVLGLNASVLVGWRERLTAEPTVSNREYPTATASDGGAVGG